MPQQYLDGSPFIDPLYELSFGPLLAAWWSPQCPASYDGRTQVYDLDTKTCTTLPKEAFTSASMPKTSGKCGAGQPHGGPFMQEINGKCYRTNNCHISSSLQDNCLDSQQVPTRANTLSESGIIEGNRRK